MPHDQQTFELMKEEYVKLKDEQVQRIGFRDNMVFVQLGLIGAIASWVFANLEAPNATIALLLIPWACLIVGWTYVVNDSAVSRIGEYLRGNLALRFGQQPAEALGWEVFHRSNNWRATRKRLQFCIDLLLFVVPGAVALVAFMVLGQGSATMSHWQWVPVGVESALMLLLIILFFRHGDFVSSPSMVADQTPGR
jgi:hypothetical protein